ncbi:unnamed protein product [Blepharisma stoltei]|uniref:Thioredoxin domain-containing protein n=1 Tax=Blepharisma stoltei TaxID=1481888 RepID=A0AAU9JAQ8_9CILI|nr:unnamed protein product [Blepharisma stoltei]
MEQLLGSVLIGKSGSVGMTPLNEAKYVLLYFSASYCPPCREFTPKLAMFYDSVNFDEKKVEVVFVSQDRTIEKFNEYYDEMPWLTIPYEAVEIRTTLIERYRGQTIPSLVLIDLQGNVKKNACRMDVANKGPLCLSDWDAALNTN